MGFARGLRWLSPRPPIPATDFVNELPAPHVEPEVAVPVTVKAPKPPKTGDEKSLVDKVKNFFKDWI